MLDLKIIRENPQAVADRLKVKRYTFDVELFLSLDKERKEADTESQNLLAQRKQASKKIGEMVKSGVPVEEAKKTVSEILTKIETQLESLKTKAQKAGEALTELVESLPNIPDLDVPEGNDEEDNIEVLKWGTAKTFNFETRDHVDIGESGGGLDFELGAKITGSRFVVMRGAIARLHRALVQFMLDTHVEQHGYEEVNVPYIVNSDSLRGTGQLPKFEEDLFKLEGEHNYYLIPTAEVPVTNIVRDRILDEEELGEGISYVCHSACFRSEAGSYGRDTRGMIRQHQFEKIEMVKIVRQDQSDKALEMLTENAEVILQKLNLAYRKVILCGGDLGFGSKKTYDLEVWLPGQGKYREISSCSNFGDFQARRMMARVRNRDTGKPEFLHTINGSGLAVGRTLVAIMENYQTEDGKVSIPEVLLPYMGGIKSI